MHKAISFYISFNSIKHGNCVFLAYLVLPIVCMKVVLESCLLQAFRYTNNMFYDYYHLKTDLLLKRQKVASKALASLVAPSRMPLTSD